MMNNKMAWDWRHTEQKMQDDAFTCFLFCVASNSTSCFTMTQNQLAQLSIVISSLQQINFKSLSCCDFLKQLQIFLFRATEMKPANCSDIIRVTSPTRRKTIFGLLRKIFLCMYLNCRKSVQQYLSLVFRAYQVKRLDAFIGHMFWRHFRCRKKLKKSVARALWEQMKNT